jgi:hypothetical protein
LLIPVFDIFDIPEEFNVKSLYPEVEKLEWAMSDENCVLPT